jgi:type VI secretion system protein ImpB
MAVGLKFRSMDDFEPAAVVNQVPALKKLQDTRNQLRDLMTKIDRSEDLEKVLERVLQNSEELKQMNSALAADAPAGDTGSKEG